MMSDDRPPDRIGKEARLEIVFEKRAGRTVLAGEYAEPPFRVGRIFPQPDGAAHLIVSSTSPGIFGGDSLQQSVRVRSGASVRLTSQSALQIHPSPDRSTARLASHYHVGPGAHLRCEWDPNIPFLHARLEQRIVIELGDRARLYWSDAVMSGREARGERWRFDRLAHELRLVRCGSLAYLERYALESGHDIVARWAAADACYFGTIIVSDSGVGRTNAEQLQQELSGIDGLRAAADLIDDSLLLVRLMSSSGPAFHRARAAVSDRFRI